MNKLDDLDLEDVLPPVDSSTGLAGPAADLSRRLTQEERGSEYAGPGGGSAKLAGPAADRPILAAGGAQEPRSAPAPTQAPVPTPGFALEGGIADLRGIPDSLLYAEGSGAYAAALKSVYRAGWGALCGGGSPLGVLFVGRVRMIGGPT